MNFYLSESASKQLKEWGCEIESEWFVIDKILFNGVAISGFLSHRDISRSYHILEDICVKHAKEFFGDYVQKSPAGEERMANGYKQATNIVFNLIRAGEKEEAEQYILDNCIFNPKNK